MAEQSLKLPNLDNTLTEVATTMQAINVGSTTSTKELVVAFGAILIAAIIFFVVKNFISKMLVSSYRKSPRSADMAGWALFCILLLATITAALAMLDSTRFLSIPYLIPIGLAMIALLVTFIASLLSKR